MDLSKLPLFDMLSQRMSWLNRRQEVLAQNIANADTPNFQPSDLAPLDLDGASHRLAPIAPVRTNPMHLVGTGGNSRFKAGEERKPYEMTPAGNGVVLEEQLVKLAETQMDYQTITNLYRKQVGMIKAALGRNV